MAISPASIQITSLSTFNLLIAYLLLTSPARLSTHTLTTLLSACFDLPYAPPSFSQPSAMSALVAVLLGYISLNDIIAANSHEEIFFWHWSAQAPVRAMFFFALTAWSFVDGPEGMSKVGKVLAGRQTGLVPSGPGREEMGLGNGMVFVFGFIMVMWWFWVSSILSFLGWCEMEVY